jgi:hypothetical protein
MPPLPYRRGGPVGRGVGRGLGHHRVGGGELGSLGLEQAATADDVEVEVQVVAAL